MRRNPTPSPVIGARKDRTAATSARRKAENHFTFVFFDPNTNQKVGQDENAKDRIDDFDQRCMFVEGRSNHEEDRHDIKGENTVAKPMRGSGVVFVEGTDFFHVVGPKEKTRPVGAGQID